MKMLKLFGVSLAALIIASPIALATQVIQDNLVVTGTVNPQNGVTGTLGGNTASNIVATGGVPAQVSTAGNDTTPVATTIYYAQLLVPNNMLVTGISFMQGTVASGNVKVCMWDAAGNVVATSASTAIVGTDAYDRIPFTTTYTAIGPQTYYAGVFIDNTTDRFNTHLFGDFRTGTLTTQVYATGCAAITPATTFTANVGPIASLY